MDDHEQAANELAALVKVPGALKIITANEHPKPPAGLDHTHPAYFVQHDVVRIEPVEHRGTLRAYSAVGDWCEGKPAPLLARLRKWRGQ